MFNPQCVHECEKEKRHARRMRRKMVDGVMTVVGLAASLSSIPQVWKIWQTGEVAGISLLTYAISFSAVLAWFFYGLYIKNKPLVITSVFAVLILGTVIVQLIIYG